VSPSVALKYFFVPRASISKPLGSQNIWMGIVSFFSVSILILANLYHRGIISVNELFDRRYGILEISDIVPYTQPDSDRKGPEKYRK